MVWFAAFVVSWQEEARDRDPAVNELIPGAAVNTQEAFRLRKISYRNQLFYSKSCSKVKKRNSYTVVLLEWMAD